MDFWTAFRQFEYSNETVLVTIGASAAAYGYDQSAVRLPDHLADEVRALIGPGQGLTDGMMEALCLKLLDSDGESAANTSAAATSLKTSLVLTN